MTKSELSSEEASGQAAPPQLEHVPDPTTGPSVAPDHLGSPLVVLSDVDKHFGELYVLQKINLTVHKGEVVVVLGPSGSGKSTLCRVINRLEPIESGTISIDGQKLPEEGKALAQLRADVGMVFQSFNLFAHKTVLDNVTLGPIKVRKRPAAQAKKRGMELLKRVGVESQAEKYPAELATARGNCPGSRDGSQSDHVRRADVCLGPRDGERGAGCDDLAGPPRHDHDRGHS